MKKIYKYMRFIGHRILPGKVRHRLYLIPYFFHISSFMKRVDLNNIELFKYIEIETINRCNGDCEFCPVNVNQPQRPYARMNEELYKKIIQELADIEYRGEIHLFSNNEPFLDNRISEFARYARQEIPLAFISIYTNGSLLTLELLKNIVPYIDLIVIDNYKPDEVNQNIEDIRLWCDTKEKGTEKVCIDKRDNKEVLSSRGGTSPNKKKVSLAGVGRGCIYPFRQMVIRPDGKCSLCCNDALGKYTLGDVNSESLLEIWHSKSYNQIRSIMLKEGRKGLNLCRECDTHFFDNT